MTFATMANSRDKSKLWFSPTRAAKIAWTATWAGYAFVEATAISGPAYNNKVWSASRDKVDPGTFVMVNDL